MTGRHARTRLPAPAALVLVSALTGLVAGAPDDPAARITRRLPFPPGGRILIDTTNGDIEIEGWSQPAVDLDVRKVGESSDDRTLVPIDVQSTADELRVSSVFPPFAPHLRAAVHYRLRVPADVDLKLLKTRKGRVSVEGVSGRAVVQTEEGPVSVTKFAGALEVTTANGEIDAEVTGPASHVVLDSFNGRILLRLPARFRAHYALSTLNGTIRTDLPIVVQHVFGPNIAHAAGDVEEPLVRLTSVNGDILVRTR